MNYKGAVQELETYKRNCRRAVEEFEMNFTQTVEDI